jgi:hypothetical protein
VFGPDRRHQSCVDAGLSESDWALLDVVDSGVEALQVGVNEVERRVRSELEFWESVEDQDRGCEGVVLLGALLELKVAARELRAWAASIGSCG